MDCPQYNLSYVKYSARLPGPGFFSDRALFWLKWTASLLLYFGAISVDYYIVVPTTLAHLGLVDGRAGDGDYDCNEVSCC